MNKYSLMICFALIFEIVLINACSEKDVKIQNTDKDIRIKGSDSEFELMKELLEKFTSVNGDITYSLEGGGSAKGIDALIKGDITIAASSREMNANEWDLAEENNLKPVPLVFALDAVAFITHPRTGIDSLSILQLSKIFSGEIRNWKDLGGSDLPIIVVGRNEFSGTYSYLLNRMHITEYTGSKISLEHNVDIYNKVKSTEGAIGYVSLGTIVSNVGKPVNDVWAVNIYTDYAKAVSPYEISKVQNGEYYFSRPLYLYFADQLSEKEKKFILFLLETSVQESLWEKGYFPITEQHGRLNTKNFNTNGNHLAGRK
jgi:phosphate transport system substrate-binding protein